VIVRAETPADRAASVEVERLAFGSWLEAGIVVAVRDEEGSFAFVADADGQVVGHVQMSRAWVGESPVVALGPIGVAPDHQGHGVGRALIEASLAEAEHRGARAVILLGSPALYPRFGFEPASAHDLRNPFAGVTEDGFTIDEDDFMIAPLGDGELSLHGEVRWHPAFG